MSTSGGRRVPEEVDPTPQRFAAHLGRARPVLVRPDPASTSALALASLADPDHVRSLLAGVTLGARNGSAAALLLRDTAGETIERSYGALIDELHADPLSQIVVSEVATPPPLAAIASLPPFAELPDDDPHDRVSHMFLAGPAAVAHLHYDGDLRDVVMLQLFGRKRYILIDPAHSSRILPLTAPGVQRTSGVFLEHLDDADRAAFLRYTHAYVCELGPGDSLYMPAGWWHHVEYLEVSLSVNHRLARNPRMRFMAEQVPVKSVEWLALAQCFHDEAAISRSPALQCGWTGLERELAATAALAPADRAAHLERTCLQLCAELELPIAGPPATVVDLERRARLDSNPADQRATSPDDVEHPMTDDAGDAGSDLDPGDVTSTSWTPDTRVRLPDGSTLYIPVDGPGLVLAEGDRLVAMMPADDTHPWTLPTLARIAREPGLSVTELAAAADVDPRLMLVFLLQMAPEGWVATDDPGDPDEGDPGDPDEGDP